MLLPAKLTASVKANDGHLPLNPQQRLVEGSAGLHHHPSHPCSGLTADRDETIQWEDCCLYWREADQQGQGARQDGRGGSAGRWLPDGVSCGGRCSAAARRGAEGRHGRPARAGGPLELSAARAADAASLLGRAALGVTFSDGHGDRAAPPGGAAPVAPPCTATTAAADTATSAAAPGLVTISDQPLSGRRSSG